MPKLLEDDERDEVINNFDDFTPGPLPPQVTAPPSVTIPHLPLAPPDPTLPATPEHFVCLRGPCRFYLEIKSPAQIENRGMGYTPEQTSRYCRAVQGATIDLGDDNVIACNTWDPSFSDYSLEQRRREFLAKNPSCSQADQKRIDDRTTAIAKRNAEADAREAAEKAAQEAAVKAAENETPNIEEWSK